MPQKFWAFVPKHINTNKKNNMNFDDFFFVKKVILETGKTKSLCTYFFLNQFHKMASLVKINWLIEDWAIQKYQK